MSDQIIGQNEKINICKNFVKQNQYLLVGNNNYRFIDNIHRDKRINCIVFNIFLKVQKCATGLVHIQFTVIYLSSVD